MAKLMDICEIQYGFAFDSKKFTNDSSYPQLVRIRDIKKGYSETFYAGEYSEDYVLQAGALLVGMDGEFNIAKWKKDGALLNQRVCKLTAKKGIDEEYLRFAMARVLKILEHRTSFVTVKHLSARDLNKLEIMIPDLEMQKNISRVLVLFEKLISCKKEELNLLEELVKARFIEVFGDMLLNSKSWREIRLDSVAGIVSGITKGRKIKSAELYEVPYMAVSNVKNGYIDWTKVKTIMATKEEIKRYKLLPNDVLMTEGGDPDKLGRGAIIKCPPNNCIHQNHIFRVRLNEELLPIYFEYYLQQIKAKRYFLKCSKQTTGIASINMKQLLALPVLIPDMESQKTFAKFTEQADKSKAVIEKSLKELETLQASLMQKYFS